MKSDLVDRLTAKIKKLEEVSNGYEDSPDREKLTMIIEALSSIEAEVAAFGPSTSATQAIAVAQFKSMINTIKRLIREYDKTLTDNGE